MLGCGSSDAMVSHDKGIGTTQMGGSRGGYCYAFLWRLEVGSSYVLITERLPSLK